MSRSLKPDTEHLRSLVAGGLTTQQIASRLGVTAQTVRNWMRQEGLAVTRPRTRPIGAWGDGARAVGVRGR